MKNSNMIFQIRDHMDLYDSKRYLKQLNSITQNKKEIMIIVVMAIVIFSLGSVTIKKYFNSKKIY